LLLVLCLALFSSPGWSQGIEITPFAGYTYGGGFSDGYYGNSSTIVNSLDLKNMAHYGLIIDVPLQQTVQLELLYSRQNTGLQLKAPVQNVPLFDVAVNYFHGGFLFHRPYGDWLPYFNFHLGATWFDPKGDPDGITRFSWALGLGAKRFISETVGIRLQARWDGTYIRSGNDYFCDPFTGFCYTYTSSVAMWQGELTGGLIFRLGS
jgi:hypothetical protein